MFDKEQPMYQNNIVTCKETRLYYYDMHIESQYKVWKLKDEDGSAPVRKSKSVKKKSIALFFKSYGIVDSAV